MSVRQSVIDQWRGGVLVMDDGSLDHRGLVIRAACDLEAELVALLAQYLVVEKHFDATRAKNEFGDWGLKKLSDLAFFLALISDEDRHDIRKLSRIRDRYAHDKERGQLDEDDEMFSHLERTHLFRSSPALVLLKRQEILMCIRDELVTRINDAYALL